MKLIWADSRFQDFLNPGPEPKGMNRKAMVSAYGALGSSFNAPSPEIDLAQAAETTIGADHYSQGWSGAYRAGAKPWL
jgi:hypothetical protein